MLAVAFTSTFNLGALVIVTLLLIGFAWASLRARTETRWRDLYELADTERKEEKEHHQQTRADLDDALRVVAEQKEIIHRLEALQMPARVMEVMQASVQQLNEQATGRQEEVRGTVVLALDQHERRAEERHTATLHVLEMIAERLGPDDGVSR